jgi:hypothetical protein
VGGILDSATQPILERVSETGGSMWHASRNQKAWRVHICGQARELWRRGPTLLPANALITAVLRDVVVSVARAIRRVLLGSEGSDEVSEANPSRRRVPEGGGGPAWASADGIPRGGTPLGA